MVLVPNILIMKNGHLKGMEGKHGLALTNLCLVGFVDIEGVLYEACADWYIHKGSRIRVVGIQMNMLKVRGNSNKNKL